MFDIAIEHLPETPLQQSAEFARALTAQGTPPLTLPDGALVLRRHGWLKAHMLARAEVTPERLTTMRDAGLRGPVILSPDAPLQWEALPVVPLISPAYLAALDLTPDLDTLQSGLQQKWRNRLRHSEKQGLRITRQNMPDNPDHWLLNADAAQQGARGYRSWPPALTCAYARENPGCAKLFTAHIARSPIAGILVLCHGRSASYHIAHTRPSGRMTSAHCLLLWQAICWLKRRDVTVFELGLVDTEEGAGLARFKLGTGAKIRPLGGTWLWWPPVTQLAHPLARLDRRLMRAR